MSLSEGLLKISSFGYPIFTGQLFVSEEIGTWMAAPKKLPVHLDFFVLCGPCACPSKQQGEAVLIIGVDEVGRGALVGDLVVCAAGFLGESVAAELVNSGCQLLDSKAFSTRKKREAAYDLLLSHSGVVYSISRKTPREIEEEGIHNAVLSAMSLAALGLSRRSPQSCQFRFDGKFRPKNFSGPESEAVVKGDAKIPEISAASIIAKVTRDREMERLAELHPEYGFEKHSGYGTKQHIAAIRERGLLEEHRSWAEKFLEDI